MKIGRIVLPSFINIVVVYQEFSEKEKKLGSNRVITIGR